jgi:hypothetical protein
VSRTAQLRAGKADMNGARVEELPVGLDWQAFLSRCFPEGRRHDLKAVAAYFAYKQLPREAAERDELASTNAVEAWEDEGGSTTQAAQEPTRRKVGAGRAYPPSRRSPIRLVRPKARPDTLFA